MIIKTLYLKACTCDSEGSIDNSCHKETGTCECKSNIEGDECTTCVSQHYGFPQCHGKFKNPCKW